MSMLPMFESFVNSEECKTCVDSRLHTVGLRALLIQKSVKPFFPHAFHLQRLRALLIQKSVKQTRQETPNRPCLRALLIQKSVKQNVH